MSLNYDYPKFTKEMKKTHTILVPNMLSVHFELLLHIFNKQGYNIKLLTNVDPKLIETGLRYVHNDICYPCLLVIGQIIDALKSGEYDTDKIALAITQTGGGCRASNYIHLLRHALVNAGLGHIPVLSINFSGYEKDNALRFSLSAFKQARAAVVYGDMLMLLHNRFVCYEQNKGESLTKLKFWIERLKAELKFSNHKRTKKLLFEIKNDFDSIQTTSEKKVRVGIVGEIYVKFSPLGNNSLEEFLRSQGAEAVVPGLMGFVMYCIANNVFDAKFYGRGKLSGFIFGLVFKNMAKWDLLIKDVLGNDERFCVPSGTQHLFKLTENVIDLGVKMGEGWLLPAEMMELIESGVNNIVCAQPFGCLPNHIVGKSVLKRIKELRPDSNITPIDYDASATRVNQENRIKLMLAVAKEQQKTLV